MFIITYVEELLLSSHYALLNVFDYTVSLLSLRAFHSFSTLDIASIILPKRTTTAFAQFTNPNNYLFT